jgi:hypothetical protein
VATVAIYQQPLFSVIPRDPRAGSSELPWSWFSLRLCVPQPRNNVAALSCEFQPEIPGTLVLKSEPFLDTPVEQNRINYFFILIITK